MARLLFALTIILYTSLSAIADTGHHTCGQHVQKVERTHGIPANYLSAMARVESGRYDSGNKNVEPWPWTVHAEGKGNYYQSKNEAIQAVQKLQNRGVKNIDVGCMQINLGHHSNAFSNLHDAFDPQKNVEYAARFLREKMYQTKSWAKAVGNYHSATPKHHSEYRKRVQHALETIRKEGAYFYPSARAAKDSMLTRNRNSHIRRPITRNSGSSYNNRNSLTQARFSGSAKRPVQIIRGLNNVHLARRHGLKVLKIER